MDVVDLIDLLDKNNIDYSPKNKKLPKILKFCGLRFNSNTSCITLPNGDYLMLTPYTMNINNGMLVINDNVAIKL